MIHPLLVALPAFGLGVVLTLAWCLWMANGRRARLVVLRGGRFRVGTW